MSTKQKVATFHDYRGMIVLEKLTNAALIPASATTFDPTRTGRESPDGCAEQHGIPTGTRFAKREHFQVLADWLDAHDDWTFSVLLKRD